MSFVLLDFVIGCFNFLTNSYFYNRFFLNWNELSYDKVVPFTKNECGSYTKECLKSLKSMSDEWLNAICWSSLLLGIFMIK